MTMILRSSGAGAARSPRLWYVAAAALALSALAVPSTASACRCVDGSLEWPERGASDVSRTTTLAVLVLPDIVAVVRDGSGNEVPTRTLTPEIDIDEPLCGRRRMLLEPTEPLLAGHTYSVEFEGSSNSAPSQDTFTTGTESFVPPASTPVELRLHRVIPAPSCTDARRCAPQVNVQVPVTSAAPRAPGPSWLVLEGTGVGGGFLSRASRAVVPLWGDDTTVRRSHALAMADGDDCVAYRQVDGRGKVIAQGDLCEAQKCVTLPPEVARGASSCGTLAALSSEEWSRVGDTSCASPPAVAGASMQFAYVLADENTTADATADTQAAGASAGAGSAEQADHEPDSEANDMDAVAATDGAAGEGCSAGPGRASPAAAWLLLCVVALATARARRRRSQRPQML